MLEKETRGGADIIRRTSKTDNYSTPIPAIEALLNHERFTGTILEPAVGEGNIVSSLKGRGYTVAYSDIRTSSEILPNSIGEVDFLGDFYSSSTFGNVITNPPFAYAMEFASKSLEVAKCKVALFLRIQFLESEKRKEFLESSPLKYVYVFSKRQSCYPEGSPYQGGGTQCFGWFIWEHGYLGRPQIKWL